MKIMTIISVAFLLFSCDPNIYVSVNEESTRSFKFDCGQVNISAISIGAQIFRISMLFNLNSDVYLNTDSLNILYKNENIPFKHFIGRKLTDESILAVESGMEIRVEFNIKEHLRETVYVNTTGYLYCKDNPVEIGKLKLQTTGVSR